MIKLIKIHNLNRIGCQNLLSVCLFNHNESRKFATTKGGKNSVKSVGNWLKSSIFVDGPLKALEKKIERDELKPDEHQVKVTQELQRIYDQIQSYQPPDTTGASATRGFFSKLFHTKPKLDPALRLKGLYIYGSVGGGKTMLMDMFFDCCTQVGDLDIMCDKNKIENSVWKWVKNAKRLFWQMYSESTIKIALKALMNFYFHPIKNASYTSFLLTFNHFRHFNKISSLFLDTQKETCTFQFIHDGSAQRNSSNKAKAKSRRKFNEASTLWSDSTGCGNYQRGSMAHLLWWISSHRYCRCDDT